MEQTCLNELCAAADAAASGSIATLVAMATDVAIAANPARVSPLCGAGHLMDLIDVAFPLCLET
jgi:hypothetical protein